MSDLYVVDEIGRFVAAAEPAHISQSARTALKRNVLDSIGCAIAALDGDVITTLRDEIESVGANPASRLIGGGRASVEQATLLNSVLVRYIDQLDTYLTPGGLCHPSDNFGAILSLADARQATGQDFLLALAVAYELQCRFSAQVPVMALGLNHALQLAISVAAGSAKLLGLDDAQTANAVAAATADNVSLAAVHSEPVSQWKGISPAITAQRAVQVTSLAARGITGPRGLFEGPNGLYQLFNREVDLGLSDPSLNVAKQTYLKKYCALIHGQPVIETILHLVTTNSLTAADISRVQLEVFQTAFDIAGGGKFGPKDVVRTKEQADYNLRYLTAAAILDGQVGPEQLLEERIQRPDIQQFMAKVDVSPDDTLTAGYPQTTPVRVILTLNDGRELAREQSDYEGALSRPLSQERAVQKFHWLSEPYASTALRGEIIDCVAELDRNRIEDLTELLAQVNPVKQYARTTHL